MSSTKKFLASFYNFKSKEDYYKDVSGFRYFCKWLGRGIRNATILAAFVMTGGLSARIYNTFHPITVYAEKTVTVEVVSSTTVPVMQRIADCESGQRDKNGRGIKGTASHLDKNGQVIIKPVMSGQYAGTYDQGFYQINSNHNASAKKLGYNLSVEKDNKAYGEWLYENEGTQPWYSSADCWQ